jgi:hypothetical protein
MSSLLARALAHVCPKRRRECAGFLKGHNAVGLVDLARLEAEILLF